MLFFSVSFTLLVRVASSGKMLCVVPTNLIKFPVTLKPLRRQKTKGQNKKWKPVCVSVWPKRSLTFWKRNKQVLENRDMVEDLEFIIFVVQSFGQSIVFFILLRLTPLARSSYPRYLTSQGFLRVLGGHPSRFDKKAAQRCSITSQNNVCCNFDFLQISIVFSISCSWAGQILVSSIVSHCFKIQDLVYKRLVLIFVFDS